MSNDDSLVYGKVLSGQFESKIEHEVHLYDETLRDGEQTVGVAFSPEQKIEIARRLLDSGIQYMSLGFPAVSEEELQTAQTIAKMGDKDKFYCFSRAKKEDVEAVLRCDVPNIIMFLATSDIHLKNKLRMTEEQAFDRMQEQIRFALEAGFKRVRFGIEDASRTPLDRLKRFAQGAIDAGASMITFADTAGCLTPEASGAAIRELKKVTKDVPIMVHMHNDMGLATANTLEAVIAGATFISGALGGMGERAGNVALEEIAVVLKAKYDLDLGLDLAKFADTARYVTEVAKFPISPGKPIIGDNVFAHESGIHVHGILRDPAAYEAFPASLIGKTHSVRFGKHAGLSNIRYVADKNNLDVTQDVLEHALAEVKLRGARGERPTETDVLNLLRGQ